MLVSRKGPDEKTLACSFLFLSSMEGVSMITDLTTVPDTRR